MNIEGAKLVSVSQSSPTVEGGGPHLSDNGSIPEGFADALKGQLELLSETKVQGELSNQFQNLVEFQQTGNLPGNAVLPGNHGDEQKLTDLSGKALLLSNTVNEDLDLKATLDALTDILKYTARGAGEELAAVHVGGKKLGEQGSASKTKDLDQILAVTEALSSIPAHPGQEKAVNNPASETGKEDVDLKASLGASLTDFFESTKENSEELAAAHADAKKLGEQESESKTDDLDQVLAVTEALSSIPAHPGQEKIANNQAQETGEELAAAHVNAKKLAGPASESKTEDLDQVLAVTEAFSSIPAPHGQEKIANNPVHETGNEKSPQSFIKPLFEDVKLNSSGEKGASEDILQKGTVFGQLVKDAQNINPNHFEKAAQSERSARIEVQPSISDVDRVLPRGMAEIAQLNRQPVDNRTDVPAMTRPLGHLEWNKELGERIVWMNNRDMPSAEIKLNPQHLGPISIRIDMNNDQATIAFTAQHAAVRDALEASIPKLREMMSDQQLNLVNINVSQNTSSDQKHSQSQSFSRNSEGLGKGAEGVADIGEEIENGHAVVSKGLLSIYA